MTQDLITGNEIFRYLVKTGNIGLGLDIGAEIILPKSSKYLPP